MIQVFLNGDFIATYNNYGIVISRRTVTVGLIKYITHIEVKMSQLGLTVVHQNPNIATNPGAVGVFSIFLLSNQSSGATTGVCGKPFVTTTKCGRTEENVVKQSSCKVDNSVSLLKLTAWARTRLAESCAAVPRDHSLMQQSLSCVRNVHATVDSIRYVHVQARLILCWSAHPHFNLLSFRRRSWSDCFAFFYLSDSSL